MNETVKLLLNRRTIRKYKTDQVKEQELNLILDAGLHTPNAGGRKYRRHGDCLGEVI